MKSFKVLGLALALALAASALGATPVAKAQDKVIKIASQSPLSGGQSVLGTAISNGTRLGVEQLSKTLEDKGFTVEYVAFDDQATPDVGVANAQNIVNDASILAVVGHLNSGVAIPSSEVYDKSNLVMVSPANTNVNVTDRGLKTVNRLCGRDDAQGLVGADYVANTLGAKSVYVLHDKTAYGEGVATSFRDAAAAAGLEVLGFDGTEEKNDFTTIITPIIAQNPDLIYFGGIYDQAALFFKQTREAGYTGTFMGPDGMDSSDTAKIGGEAVVGMVYTTTAGPASVYPDAAQFVTDYKARFSINPEPYAVESYSAVQVIVAAIDSITTAGGDLPTREAVAAAVRATSGLSTLIGPITFDANGDPDYAAYYVLKVASADPAAWSDPGNELAARVEIASPLTAAMATPEATPSQ
ncbi:MAG: branched-chain amino acid ABC transporter substrate-binding protein [Anaerolineae bacterium]|nr:branched-chain amino acid ABC transporter substrate-binding protein [Anaerolineae bacterium]